MNYRYLVAYLGQHRKFDRPNIADVEGFDNYTPEVLDKLKDLYKAGTISSWPVMQLDNQTIIWLNDDGRWDRDGNLPAVETNTGVKKYMKNHSLHRTDGPADIGPEGLVWAINGKAIASQRKNSQGRDFYFREVTNPISEAKYAQLIKEAFPGVTKYFIDDWFNK